MNSISVRMQPTTHPARLISIVLSPLGLQAYRARTRSYHSRRLASNTHTKDNSGNLPLVNGIPY